MKDIDNILFRLQTASINYRTDAERHWMRCAADDIAWYLKTDRAPLEWLVAISKANMTKILRRMASADDKSSKGQISIATAYLRRYCGYKG